MASPPEGNTDSSNELSVGASSHSRKDWRTHNLTATPYTTFGRRIRIESETEIKSLPPGAFRVTRNEMRRAIEKQIYKKGNERFQRLNDYWPWVSGAAVGVTSAFLISIVRVKFKLGRYHARGLHYTVGAILPAITASHAHERFIQEQSWIRDVPCQECLAVRSSLLFGLCGVAWPMFLSVVGSLYYARRYYTVPLPPVQLKYAKEYGKIFALPFKTRIPLLSVHVLFQLALGYMGGILFWNAGNELDAVESYVARKSESMNPATGETLLDLYPIIVNSAKTTGALAAKESDSRRETIDESVTDDSAEGKHRKELTS